MPLRVITKPTDNPVTLAMLKQNLRLEVDDTSRDGLLKLLLGAAVDEFEDKTSRQLCKAEWELVLPAFLSVVYLDKNPVQEVLSVTYFDENGEQQTMDESLYDINIVSKPATIEFKELPTTADRYDAVLIRFNAGYRHVPEAIQLALMSYVTQRYQSPGNAVDKLPTHFTKQVRNYRVWKQTK